MVKRTGILLLVLFLYPCLTIPAQDSFFPGKVTINAGNDVGLLLEKGVSIARLLLYERVRVNCLIPGFGGAFDVGISGGFGTLMGSHRSIVVDGAWMWETKQMQASALGASCEIEWGNSIFYGGIGSPVPWVPMVYAGALYRPFMFRTGDWMSSWLDISLLVGISPTLPVRFRINIFSLSYSPVEKDISLYKEGWLEK